MNRLMYWIRAHKTLAAVGGFILLWVLVAGTDWRDASSRTYTSTSNQGITGLSVGAPEMFMMDANEGDGVMMAESFAVKTNRISPPFEQTAGETAADVDQKIIKTGNISAVFEDIDGAVTDLTSYVKNAGGFIGHSSISENRQGIRSGRLSMRVPVAQFEMSMTYVRDLSDFVSHESVNGQDVTEQYTDLQARLKNAKSQETAYLAVLDKARSVEDILKVQRELGNIRSQIESLEGRKQYLENKTSFSTIEVSLEEDVQIQIPTGKFKPFTVVKQAVAALVNAFQNIFVSLIWTVIVGLGLGLPALLGIWILYRIIKRFWLKK